MSCWVYFGLHGEAALVEGDLHDGRPGQGSSDSTVGPALLSDQQAGLCEAHPHQIAAVILCLEEQNCNNSKSFQTAEYSENPLVAGEITTTP